MNYIIFDQQYKVINMLALRSPKGEGGGWTVVPTTANFAKQKITVSPPQIKEAGYVFVYLSYENQSNNLVLFDDLKVTHTKNNIVQYNEYYAFQHTTSHSWTRENTTGNNFLGNGGTEVNTTTALYDLDFRNFDPLLARMHQIDPVAAKYASLTPYNFSFNDPVAFNDPSGADPDGRANWTSIVLPDFPAGPMDYGTAGGPASRGGGPMTGFYWGGQVGTRMSMGEFIYTALYGSSYGGHWSGGRGFMFTSPEQAMAYGAAYNDYHSSWGNTAQGSRKGTYNAYNFVVNAMNTATAGVDWMKSTIKMISRIAKMLEGQKLKKPPMNLIASGSDYFFPSETYEYFAFFSTRVHLYKEVITSALGDIVITNLYAIETDEDGDFEGAGGYQTIYVNGKFKDTNKVTLSPQFLDFILSNEAGFLKAESTIKKFMKYIFAREPAERGNLNVGAPSDNEPWRTGGGYRTYRYDSVIGPNGKKIRIKIPNPPNIK